MYFWHSRCGLVFADFPSFTWNVKHVSPLVHVCVCVPRRAVPCPALWKPEQQAVLIVNVASHCGYTDSNYRELQALRANHSEVRRGAYALRKERRGNSIFRDFFFCFVSGEAVKTVRGRGLLIPWVLGSMCAC